MRGWSFYLGFGLLLMLNAACSGGDKGDGVGSDLASGEVSCQGDARVAAYSDGLKKDGEQGALSFKLLGSDPSPPIKGNDTFTVQVLDGDEAADQVELGVDLTMPDHGHGTMVEPQIEPSKDGKSFQVSQLYLFMAGVWRIDFTAYEAGSEQQTPLDNASFFFCIEG